MSLTEEEVRKVAQLARISLTDEEVKRFAPQMERIFDYFSLLNEVDTGKTQVLAHVHGLTDITRPDAVEPWVPREEMLSASPLPLENNQIKVPSVFDES